MSEIDRRETSNRANWIRMLHSENSLDQMLCRAYQRLYGLQIKVSGIHTLDGSFASDALVAGTSEVSPSMKICVGQITFSRELTTIYIA